ncbi:MAG TPA: alpha-amylase family glycosyl hydrolase [Candidatus Saccharimonadales bacterium]|nr:alpha-amylase family glycosyl hydrolase [Candidatus Saccharimonadales bacterium]
MPARRYPALYQINTRIRMAELSAALGRPATLGDLPDDEIDALAESGFSLIWLLGVWQTGEASRRVSRSDPELLAEFRSVLPDLRESDICGSCFAVRAYRVHEDFGGDAALERLRARLRRRGMGLILDFVPNHVALDHPWIETHPEYFIEGDEDRLAAEPRNYVRVKTARGERILAYGRDPNYPGWTDTLQLDYSHPALQEAMVRELQAIARRCDGVRCDMAMLLLPEVFQKTWGRSPLPFWPRATDEIRQEIPGFVFLAEVYWDLEWTLQQQGFDFTYDKRLYDRLAWREARPVREHLLAGLDYQERLARFLENHDEPRAAATFPPEIHRAAAVITYLAPGLRLFHQGQREGKRVRVPVHLSRGPVEPIDLSTAVFYDDLLRCLKASAFHEGDWSLLECRSAWDGNWTWDAFVAFAWSGPGRRRRLVAVNDSDHHSQCYVALPWDDLEFRTWRFHDLMGPATYDRPGDTLAHQGLYLDLAPWGTHVFDVTPLDSGG